MFINIQTWTIVCSWRSFIYQVDARFLCRVYPRIEMVTRGRAARRVGAATLTSHAAAARRRPSPLARPRRLKSRARPTSEITWRRAGGDEGARPNPRRLVHPPAHCCLLFAAAALRVVVCAPSSSLLTRLDSMGTATGGTRGRVVFERLQWRPVRAAATIDDALQSSSLMGCLAVRLDCRGACFGRLTPLAVSRTPLHDHIASRRRRFSR